ncbi:MAG: tetratricopeptide repeat protein [Spirochaetaceae bacterium]|nr:tetratricopeptide repeat protein [Spirochaetaceae bacterium]
MIKKIFFVLLLFFSVMSLSYTVEDTTEVEGISLLVQGYEAFQKEDWVSARLFLKKAIAFDETSTPEVLYLLILSEMYAEDYQSTFDDAVVFVAKYPSSVYVPVVQYQMARSLYYLNRFEEALQLFGQFCNQYVEHELYSNGLFWMGECLYASYYFSVAKPLFMRVIEEFPQSPKYAEAVYRLNLIELQEKEEKLLYLLKVTGEEYLSAKEDYERQLKMYQTEESLGLRKQLNQTTDELATTKLRLEEISRQSSDSELKLEEVVQQNLLLNEELVASKEELVALKTEKETLMQEKLVLEETIKQLQDALHLKNETLETVIESQKNLQAQETAKDDVKDQLEQLKIKALQLQNKILQEKQK